MSAPHAITDPAHGRPIPTGPQIARVLRAFFARQYGEVVSAWRLAAQRGGRQGLPVQAPALGHWTPRMVEVLAPLVAGYYREGGEGAIRRIAQALARRQRSWGEMVRRGGVTRPRFWGRRKDEGGASSLIGLGFDLFNPRVQEAVRAATFAFCDSTNQTATDELQATLDRLREALSQGLEAGQALPVLTAKVQELFADPMRAHRIAASESSRALHAGQVMAAKDSGVVSAKRWLASSDACARCLALGGKEVGLEEPFATQGKGPYAVTYHPPLHPFCQCAMQEVLG